MLDAHAQIGNEVSSSVSYYTFSEIKDQLPYLTPHQQFEINSRFVYLDPAMVSKATSVKSHLFNLLLSTQLSNLLANSLSGGLGRKSRAAHHCHS